MQVPVAVHQVSTSYLQAMIGPSDEDPHSDHVDPQDAIGAIYGKVLDGLAWMSNYDPHPNAVSGLATVRDRAVIHSHFDRDWLPWGNVLGNDAHAEGRLAGEIAEVTRAAKPRRFNDNTATFIANVEPYPQFWTWRGEASASRVHEYVRGFRQARGQELRLWVDARGWQLSEARGIGFRHWMDAIRENDLAYRVLPEVYWTDFRVNPGHALRTAESVLSSYSVPMHLIEPTFPGDATPSEMVSAIQYAHERGMGRPNIWQRLNLRPDTAIAIAELDDPWDPAPSPPPSAYTVPIETARAMLARAGAASASLARIREDREAISERMDATRDQIEDVIATLEQLGEQDLTPAEDIE
ncbi:hypothetical protein LCGC14_0592460 [marine sediment metagenome]|uniref:Uncharacterized protein n=1 Tax=marine sediment metagenome TaxID=412755 RepID=A0A0F9ULH5_9ZZZZ